MAQVNLFVGPTAHGLDPGLLSQRGLRVHGPVRRGDIETLVKRTRKPAVIVVCDGVFQTVPAVAHAELCLALDAGWQVWGVSSIGAIRGFELRDEGMRGFGHVYAMLRRFDDFTDDEMCLLHFPEQPYFPVSEPLVNLRFALARLQHKLEIAEGATAGAILALREMWFGDRTLERMRQAMVERGGIEATKADAVLDWLVRNRVKTLDLRRLLVRRPWRQPRTQP